MEADLAGAWGEGEYM